jgi:sarcosine oxidase subunit beta
MQYPVVVVGSGIVGSAVAFELQARGTPTILVERDVEPRGASAFSFASFSAFDEPLREVYALKCHGMAGWRKWAKRFGADLGVTWDGEIRWAEKERSAAQLRGLIDLAQRRGYPVHSIGVEDISRRLPGSAPEGALAASFAPEDGQADPVRAIEVLRDAFMELGGRVLVGRARLLLDESSVRAAIDREGD